jgi:hypothetical protein
VFISPPSLVSGLPRTCGNAACRGNPTTIGQWEYHKGIRGVASSNNLLSPLDDAELKERLVDFALLAKLPDISQVTI